jgi:histidinol-phosphate aminotransferase
VNEGRNVFVLRTFSKAYGLAGLRVGYALAPSEGIELLHRVRQPFNVNALAQAAVVAALADDEHVARTREMTITGLAFLAGEMKRLGFDCVPSVANFMLVKVGRGRAVFDALLHKKVIVRPMDVYDLPDYVRITVGTGPENDRVVRALESLIEEGLLPT